MGTGSAGASQASTNPASQTEFGKKKSKFYKGRIYAYY
jgi:hypothetical protein